MTPNLPSEDGNGEQNTIEQADQQMQDQEFLSILEQLDQGIGMTHDEVNSALGDAIYGNDIPSFEQSWQESAEKGVPYMDSDQHNAFEEAPATIPMESYEEEPVAQPVVEQPEEDHFCLSP